MFPVIALTATAIDRVRDDIAENLNMQRVYREIDTFHRPNLNFAVINSPATGTKGRHTFYEDFSRFFPLTKPSTCFGATANPFSLAAGKASKPCDIPRERKIK